MLKLANNAKWKMMLLIGSIIVFATLLMGCNDGNVSGNDIYATQQEASIDYSEGLNPSKEPRVIKYLVPNSLIETEMTRSDGNESDTYPSYSGLESESLESALNMSIQEAVNQVNLRLNPETIVPYRGIKQLINEESTVTQKNVYAYTSFSYNNILSVQIYGSAGYNNKDKTSYAFSNPNYSQGEVYISTMKALVIDLGTGKSIPLKGLFIDGYDYVSVINDYIIETLGKDAAMEESYESFQYTPFKLVKPFDGIDENQSFSLDGYGVTLLFEPSDARFNTSFNPVTLSVPLELFGDSLAIDTKYYSKEASVFKDKTEKRAFSTWINGSKYSETFQNGTYKNGDWSVTVSKLNGFENDLLDKAVKDTVDSLNKITSDDIKGSIYVQFSATHIGDYVIITKNYWNDNNGVSITSDDTFIYDASGQQITLEDLFVPRFDYQSIIKSKLNEDWPILTDDQIETMVRKIEFYMSTQSLELRFEPIDENNPFEYTWLSLPYDVFGIENLVIFD